MVCSKWENGSLACVARWRACSGELRRLRHQHPATARGDDLVPIEREDPGDAEGASGPAPMSRPECLGRVLNERHVEPVAQRLQRRVVGSLSIEVDGDHRGWEPTHRGPLAQHLLDQARIQVPALGRTVDENWMRSQVGDSCGTGDECEGRNQHLVPALDADQQQSEVQRRRSAGQGHGMRHARLLGQFALEGVEVRPGRRDPVGVESLEEHLPLFVSHVRRGEEDAGHCGVPAGSLNPPTRTAAPSTASATTRSIPRATVIDAWPSTATTVTTNTATSTAM